MAAGDIAQTLSQCNEPIEAPDRYSHEPDLRTSHVHPQHLEAELVAAKRNECRGLF